jgi:hypothetical protein
MRHVFLLAFLGICMTIHCQSRKYSAVTIDSRMLDTFSFVHNWEYPWCHDVKGPDKHWIDSLGKASPEDTAHLYYQAELETNVLTVYPTKFVAAYRKDDTVYCSFYGNTEFDDFGFGVGIVNGRFYIDSIAKPLRIRLRNHTSYKIIDQRLVLNQNLSASSNQVFGYVDFTFQQIFHYPDAKPRMYTYYACGYFKAPIQPDYVPIRQYCW